MVYKMYQIDNAIAECDGWASDAEVTIIEIFDGSEEIPEPYYKWVEHLRNARNELSKITEDVKYKQYLKQEMEDYEHQSDLADAQSY